MKPYMLIKTAPQLKKFVDEGGKIGVSSDGALYIYDGGATRITPEQASEILEQPLEFIHQVIATRGDCDFPIDEKRVEEVQEKAPEKEVVHKNESSDEKDPEKESDTTEEKVKTEPDPDPFEEFQKHLENLDDKFKMLDEEITKLKNENLKLKEEVESLKL